MSEIKSEKNESEIRTADSKLPPGWRWVKLGEVCQLITDGTHYTPHYLKEGIPFLSVKNVRESYLDFENVQYISEEEHRELIKRCHPQKGDVLYTKVGTTGIARAIDTNQEFSIFVSVALLRPDRNEVIHEYLEKVLNSPICREQAKALTQGVGNQNLVIKDLKRIEFPLSPLPEQKRIAAKIQDLMQEVERARTACEKQLEAAKALPAAYLQEVFKSEEAEKWERKRLKDVCEIITGSTPRTDDPTNWNGDILWATPNDMGKLTEFIIDNTERKISEKGFKSCSTKLLPPGSVLLTTRAPIGHLAINTKTICTNQGFKSFIPSPQIHDWFLFFALKYFVPVLQSMGRGQTFTEISKRQVESFEIPLPPLLVQQRIAAELKEKMAQVEKLRISIERQLEVINALPQAILSKAFGGKLGSKENEN